MARNIMHKWIAVALLSLIVPRVTGQQAQPVQNTVEVGETESLDGQLTDDLTKANSVLKDLKSLAGALGNFSDSPGKITSVIMKFAGAAKYFGAVGAVLGLVEVFLPGEASPVMKKLNAISAQIDALQDQNDAWFTVIQKQMSVDTCKTLLSKSVQAIHSAHQQLLVYREKQTNLTRSLFMQACEGGGLCENSANTLLNSLNGTAGPAGCNLMEVAYQGWAKGYLQGSLISMQIYVGELVMLAAHSISVLAAFEAMKLGDKQKGKQKAEEVASLYQDRFQEVATRWSGFLKKAYSSVPQNVQVSATQWASQNVKKPVSELTNGMAGFLRHNYGSHLFTVFTTSAQSYFYPSGATNGKLYCYSDTSPDHVNDFCLQVEVGKLVMTVVLLPKVHQTSEAAQAVQWLKQHCGNSRSPECQQIDPKTFQSQYSTTVLPFYAQVDLSHDDHGSTDSSFPFAYNDTGDMSKYAFFTTWTWRQKHGFLNLRHWDIRSWYITVR